MEGQSQVAALCSRRLLNARLSSRAPTAKRMQDGQDAGFERLNGRKSS
jgi:hypothetical protein